MLAMRIVQLSDNYSVTMQIDPDDVESFAQDGFKTIICNRPDGEEFGQPTSASVREACEKHGIAFHMIPMRGSAVSPDMLQQFLDVIRNADGPVLGYCRSGTRSAILWQVASQTQ
jgi:sulfide:quinone oxidoreductase